MHRVETAITLSNSSVIQGNHGNYQTSIKMLRSALNVLKGDEIVNDRSVLDCIANQTTDYKLANETVNSSIEVSLSFINDFEIVTSMQSLASNVTYIYEESYDVTSTPQEVTEIVSSIVVYNLGVATFLSCENLPATEIHSKMAISRSLIQLALQILETNRCTLQQEKALERLQVVSLSLIMYEGLRFIVDSIGDSHYSISIGTMINETRENPHSTIYFFAFCANTI